MVTHELVAEELAVVEIRVFIADEEIFTVEAIDTHQGPWTLDALLAEAVRSAKVALNG